MISVHPAAQPGPERAARRERDVQQDAPFNAALAAAMTPPPDRPPPPRTGSDAAAGHRQTDPADGQETRPAEAVERLEKAAGATGDTRARLTPGVAKPAVAPLEQGLSALTPQAADAQSPAVNALMQLLRPLAPETPAAADADAPRPPKPAAADQVAAPAKPPSAVDLPHLAVTEAAKRGKEQHGPTDGGQDDARRDPAPATQPAEGTGTPPAAAAPAIGAERVSTGPRAAAGVAPNPLLDQAPAPTPDVSRQPLPVDRITIPLGTEGASGAQLRVAVRGDVLHATILAADAGTARSLESGLGDLRRSLEQYGFRESRLVVQQARPAAAPADTRGDSNRPDSGRREREHSQRDPGSAREDSRRRSPRQH